MLFYEEKFHIYHFIKEFPPLVCWIQVIFEPTIKAALGLNICQCDGKHECCMLCMVQGIPSLLLLQIHLPKRYILFHLVESQTELHKISREGILFLLH